jgi:uncharacterized protein (DUF433 family)
VLWYPLVIPGLAASESVAARIIRGPNVTRKTLDRHIEIVRGASGSRAHIAGRRIGVDDIAISHERLGRSPDEIAAEYDVTLADVHAALAYYFDHRDEIDRQIEDDRKFAESLRARTPSKLTERLRHLSGGD